jgi:murein DD-endopeptidase MepM/ murein hydrolase activator NlpD
MIISGDSNLRTRKIHLSAIQTQVLAFSLFSVLVAAICYVTFVTIRYHDISSENTSLRTSLDNLTAEMSSQVSDLSTTNASLKSENDELKKANEDLSKAVLTYASQKDAEDAQAAEAALPKGFPLSSQSTYELRKDDPSSESTDNADKGNQILLFKVSKGTKVLASGDGVISTITADSKYSHSLTVDHGNGYQSIYRCSGDVLFKEGSTVSRGDALILTGKDTFLGYQILYNDEFINPEDMLEISG